MYKYDLNSAMEAIDIEVWVHGYLCSEGNNKGFSDGLKNDKRYFSGPYVLPLSWMDRSCGPESYHKWQQAEADWNKHVDVMLELIRKGTNLPPIIVEMTGGKLVVNDGNHRYEAYYRLGYESVPVILWNSESYEMFREYEDESKVLISYLFKNCDYRKVAEGKVKRNYLILLGKDKYILSINDYPGLLELNNYRKPEELDVGINQFSVASNTKKVIRRGTFGNSTYKVTNYIEGETLSNYIIHDNEVYDMVVKELCKIHKTQVKNMEFGRIHDNDNKYSTYKEFIEAFFSKEQDGYWQDWYRLFDSGHIDKELFFEIYKILLNKIHVLEGHQYLIHGDYHLGNILFEKGEIVGVIDWDNGMIGDFVYDLTCLSLITKQDLTQIINKYYQDNFDLSNFEERRWCCYLIISLDQLRFFAKNSYRKEYNSLVEELRKISKNK